MGVLARSCAVAAAGALAMIAGCYSPDLHDCAVTCAGPSDCAPDQVCGHDGYCASPDVAGECAAQLRPDARVHDPHHVDAADPDAGPPDADPAAALRIDVTGQGTIKLDGALHGDCESTSDAGTTCTEPSELGAMVKLSAMTKHGWHFTSWSDAACPGPSCDIVLGPGTTIIGATFDHGD